jgi:hypothetical protein
VARRKTPPPVDLDCLNIRRLAAQAAELHRRLKQYQRHAAAARFGVTEPAALAWLVSSRLAFELEAELSKLGLPAHGRPVSGSPDRVLASDGLREWLLAMRGQEAQGWGQRGWGLPTQRGPLRKLPDLGGPLQQLRELVRELVGAASGRPPAKGKPGRRGYPARALSYAKKLREDNPQMKAAAIRRKCLERFSEDDLPPDPDSFRRWLNRERANRAD